MAVPTLALHYGHACTFLLVISESSPTMERLGLL